jgi:hypothetical protein
LTPTGSEHTQQFSGKTLVSATGGAKNGAISVDAPPTVVELARMLLDRTDLAERYRNAIAGLLAQADADA